MNQRWMKKGNPWKDLPFFLLLYWYAVERIMILIDDNENRIECNKILATNSQQKKITEYTGKKF